VRVREVKSPRRIFGSQRPGTAAGDKSGANRIDAADQRRLNPTLAEEEW
jgi:hypothetical protein